MEEARRVLERLARISDLERAQAPPPEVLDELRELVREAELWLRAEGEAGGAEAAVARCRTALAVDGRTEVVLLAHNR
jgi:hypothetical protein